MRPEIYRQMSEDETRHWWFCARREIISSLIERHLGNGEHRILDAGCGTGGNLPMLGRFGQVTGVEMDQYAAQMAREKKVANIVEGYLPNHFPIAADERFDLIVSLDVLEHIDDDVASLRRLRENLAAGGRMVVTVPAFPWLWSAHDKVHHHKRRYTRDELRSKIESVGLKVGYISYYNSLLFPAAAMVRGLQRLRGRSQNKDEPQVDVSMPAGWLNRILYGLFIVEKYLIGRITFPFGLSLVAVIEIDRIDSEERQIMRKIIWSVLKRVERFTKPDIVLLIDRGVGFFTIIQIESIPDYCLKRTGIY